MGQKLSLGSKMEQSIDIFVTHNNNYNCGKYVNFYAYNHNINELFTLLFTQNKEKIKEIAERLNHYNRFRKEYFLKLCEYEHFDLIESGIRDGTFGTNFHLFIINGIYSKNKNMKLIISYCTDLQLKGYNREGFNALMMAIRTNNHELIELLQERGMTLSEYEKLIITKPLSQDRLLQSFVNNNLY